MSWLTKSKVRRVVLTSAALLGVVVVALSLYFLVGGHRQLERELTLLRASGAAEFPEQIQFAPRAPGKDPSAWWKERANLETFFEIKDVGACSARLAAGETESEIERDCLACLSDPRRLEKASECELEFLNRRAQALSAAIALAAEIASIAPYDWQAAWTPHGAGLEALELYIVPPVPGYLATIDALCADAVQRAVHGDHEGARQRLNEGYRAVSLLEDSQTSIAFLAWNVGVEKWIKVGLLPVLHLSLAGSEFADLDSRLQSIDVAKHLHSALIGERAMVNSLFRWQRTNVEMRGWKRAWNFVEGLATRIWIDGDQATYLRLLRLALEAASGPSGTRTWNEYQSEFERAYDGTLARMQRPFWLAVIARFEEQASSADQLQALIALAGSALIARHDGADAARAWLDGRVDPFDGKPLRSRLDTDGLVVMWSVGRDGRDDLLGPSTERAKKTLGDDIVVSVRPR